MGTNKPAVPDADFISLIEQVGINETAKRIGVSQRRVLFRRANLEKRYGRQIKSPNRPDLSTRHADPHPGWLSVKVSDGHVLIGSDLHLWPGPVSTAFRGFVKFCKDLKPKAVIANGDVLDFPQISRHPPIGHQHLPTVEEEIENAQERLSEIEKATFKARKIWTLGNHDSRYETRLATVAPEFARLNGFSLKSYFPHWETAWAVEINDDVVVKHRWKGGVHATRNNALNSGKTMITGHLHSAKVAPMTDYNGTRYGVDTGCIADPDARAFLDYTEASPKDWRSAFCVLTFKGGRLLQPELALVWDEKNIEFRGEVIRV